MSLLAPSDPVFVVDLTPATMDACRVELAEPGLVPSRLTPPSTPERPIRAVALVFAWDADPVLLSIRPTADTAMLDGMARLIRVALITGRTIANLVTEAGDEQTKRLYFSRQMPRFIYDGVPAPVRHRVPAELQAVLGRRRRRRRTS